MTQGFDNLTLSQRVYAHLREEILTDRLSPGTELSEVALSRELEISRGPIREAIGRLAAEGLIKVRPRRRAEVRSLSSQEFTDACQVREALEVLAVRLAIPRLTDADVAYLELVTNRMAEYARRQSVEDFLAADEEFHEILCQLSGNAKLQEVRHRLDGEIGRFQPETAVMRSRLNQAVAERREILAAIRRGDVDQAAALTAAHISVSRSRLAGREASLEAVGAVGG